MPPHTTYVEPFGGAMSVMLRKPPVFLNVYNDIDSMVVNFFRVLRDRPEELIRAIELTPYSREEYINSQIPTDDPLEQARRYYVWCWQGRGRGGISEPGGWRFMKAKTRGQTPVDDWGKTDYLFNVAKYIRDNVQIEHGDALTIIRRYDTPDTLFYLDPPYVHSTRGERWAQGAYSHELSDEEHTALAEALHNIKGMAIISGYPSELYDSLYSTWRIVRRIAYAERNRETTEVLWMNYEPIKRLL